MTHPKKEKSFEEKLSNTIHYNTKNSSDFDFLNVHLHDAKKKLVLHVNSIIYTLILGVFPRS